MHVSRRLACNQKAAASAQASDITPRLRRRALTSMFISLETRHLVWDSNNLFFIFIFQFLVGPVFFSTKQSQEKLTPNFAYIVLTNAVGLCCCNPRPTMLRFQSLPSVGSSKSLVQKWTCVFAIRFRCELKFIK